MIKSNFPALCASLLAVSSVLMACTDHSTPPPAPAQTLGEKDANRAVSLQVGEILAVRLPSNATTGFEWEVAKTDAKILPVEGETEFFAPQTDRAGAPGEQIWRFKGLAKGKVKLELHYRRPWEKVKPAQIWSASVEVK